jgi:hypothetical protein
MNAALPTDELVDETIRNRFGMAIAASERTIVDIETAAGLKRDRLRDFIARRKRGIGLADAGALAVELGTSLEYLAAIDLRRKPEAA